LGTEPDRGGGSLATGELAEVPSPTPCLTQATPAERH
jgi:hypothetical protein